MSAIVIYFVFSSSVPLRLNFGKINPRAIKNTIGTAEPTPFAVLPLLIISPRSAGFGVITFGRLQNGTSDAV